MKKSFLVGTIVLLWASLSVAVSPVEDEVSVSNLKQTETQIMMTLSGQMNEYDEMCIIQHKVEYGEKGIMIASSPELDSNICYQMSAPDLIELVLEKTHLEKGTTELYLNDSFIGSLTYSENELYFTPPVTIL